MATSWRLEDLQELEGCELAAELESTNLTGLAGNEDSYNWSEVLSKLTEDPAETLPFSLATPLLNYHEELQQETRDGVSFVLNTPTAHGIKKTQEIITYMNRGQPYELQLQCKGTQSTDTLYKSVVSLGFFELRLRNCEQEQFEQWSREHPLDRLLEIDKVGCYGLSNVQNDEQNLSAVSFLWSPLNTAILAVKVNCLSTEFAARKHGGERGIPLQLKIDTYSLNNGGPETSISSVACTVKIFKDKGAERKQKVDQQKMEKLPPMEYANFHPSRNVTQFYPVPLSLPTTSLPFALSPSSPHNSHSRRSSNQSGASPSFLATPPPATNPTNQIAGITMTSSIQETRDWLNANRFTSYLSLFVNYCGADLLRLSRNDLMELCGAADGIRLYNALRSATVKMVYVCLDHESVYQALCLEHLSARELESLVATKLQLVPSQISRIVRLTLSGILVLMDDTVVRNLRDEDRFLLQVVKEENGRYQVIMRDHVHSPGLVSLGGVSPRLACNSSHTS